MSEQENKKVTAERSKSTERRRPIRDRKCKDRERSLSKLVLPTLVPQTKQESIEFHDSPERDGTHFIIRIPHSILGKSFSQQKEGCTHRSRKVDIRVSQNSNQTITFQVRLSEGTTIAESMVYIQGKCFWISTQIQSKVIDYKKKVNHQYVMMFKQRVREPVSDIFLDFIIDLPQSESKAYKGIVNQGNTCYMNSYLQVLYHIQKFRQLIFDLEPSAQDKFPRTFQNMFYQLTSESSNKQVGTQDLSKSYGWTKREVDVQQDIQQFSCVLLEVVEKKVKQQRDEEIKDRFYSIFQGEYNNYIQCLNVNYSSNRVDKFHDIQLSVHNVSNLMDSLHQYFQSQVMEGDNIYKTDEFGPQRAIKGIELKKLPEVLFIHLKRFDFDAESEMHGKIMSRYQYPPSIDFKQFIKDSPPPLYQLYGVVVHDGSKCNSGHYYSFIKIKNKWFKFNDEIVTPATDKEVFDDNYGGTEYLLNFDSKQFTIGKKQVKVDSTAYMLIYYNSSQEKQLFRMPNLIPEWMREERKQEEAERNKAMEEIDIQIIDWLSIQGGPSSSCGILLQIDSNNGEIKEVNLQETKVSQNYPLLTFINNLSQINGVEPQEITCWVFQNLKSKELYVNPFSIKDNPTFGDLFKSKDNNILILLHPTKHLMKNLPHTHFQDISAESSLAQPPNTQQLKEEQLKLQCEEIPPPNPDAEQNRPERDSNLQKKQGDDQNSHLKDFRENNAIVIIVKLYEIDKDGVMSFRFTDFQYGNKFTKFTDLRDSLDAQYQRPGSKVTYYKQKKKAFDVEEIAHNQLIFDNNTKNRFVIIVVERIDESNSTYSSLVDYLEAESKKIVITFANTETGIQSDQYLRRDMSVGELRGHILERYYRESSVEDASYINIKYRIQKTHKKYQEAYNSALTIDTLVKYEKTLYFSASIIRAEEREHSALFTIAYRNNYNFNYSSPVSFVLPKNSDVKTIVAAALQTPIIKSCTFKDTYGVRLLHLDESHTRILRIFKEEDELWTIWNKSKGYLILDGVMMEPARANVVIVQNKTKDHYYIGIPFILEAPKQMLPKDILFTLLNTVRNMRLQYDDKIHQLNEKKLRFFLYPSHLSSSKAIILDKENEESELETLYPEDNEFYIDVLHLSISSPFQAMKINIDA